MNALRDYEPSVCTANSYLLAARIAVQRSLQAFARA